MVSGPLAGDDAAATLSRAVSLRAAIAHADGAYRRYPAGPCPIERIGNAAASCNLSGGRLPGLSRWSGMLGADIVQPVNAPGGGDIVFHADAVLRTRQGGDPTGSRFTTIGGYTLVNASIAYRDADGWKLAVFSRNLLDRDYIQNVTLQAGNSGLILATPSDPRVIGVTVRLWR